MLYEAEQHCFGGKYDFNFFASVGLARSSNGGKTWPASGAAGRYPILQLPGAKPTITPVPPEGDDIPSAYVDAAARPPMLYVTYGFNGDSAHPADGFLRVARAPLGGGEPLQVVKWNGGWNHEAGLGGLDAPMTATRGCHPAGNQAAGQISPSEPLNLYLFTLVCVNLKETTPNNYVETDGAWYFSTATSLDAQDWSAPQPIAESHGVATPSPTTTCPADSRRAIRWLASVVHVAGISRRAPRTRRPRLLPERLQWQRLGPRLSVEAVHDSVAAPAPRR